MRYRGTNLPWHVKTFAALGISWLCLFWQHLLREQGYSTLHILGGEFGFARIKSLTFLVWQGELFRFPFDAMLFLLAAGLTVFAMVVARRHFKRRGSHA
jgi:hypothetical protein